MNTKITAVINTFNEQENIKRAISSVSWADEIIVCDMHSMDKTAEIAKKMGARVIYHKKENYVEPARNFGISKATGEWILVLDADEEMPLRLAEKLKKIAKKETEVGYVDIPRKNIIFGKWIKYSGWWPDYQTRFFRKGNVIWKDAIHSQPEKKGLGLTIEAEETLAITHYNYRSIGQFIQRMDRYTDVEAWQLHESGYVFGWQDLFSKPLAEFLSRFFALEGYKDGLHGLILSLLQAFSFLTLYLKLWEKEGFKEKQIEVSEVRQQLGSGGQALEYWFKHSGEQSPFKKFVQKLKF